MTVAPRATAGGASSREVSAPAEKSAMSTPVERLGAASAISRVPALDRDRPAGRPLGREQPQLADGKLPFEEDLDHRPPDDAGGADDRDGEGLACHVGHGSAVTVAGRARREYSSGPFRSGARTSFEGETRRAAGRPAVRACYGVRTSQTGSLAR